MFNQMKSQGYAILIWLGLITAILSIICTLAHTKDLEKESVIVDWILSLLILIIASCSHTQKVS